MSGISVESILVIVIVIIPGVLAEWIMSLRLLRTRSAGVLEQLARYILLSITGLSLYFVARQLVGLLPDQWFIALPPPEYLLPRFYATGGITEESLRHAVFSYAGHLGGAVVVGLLTPWFLRVILSRFSSYSLYSDSWESFVKEQTAGRWVVVYLKDGSALAGILEEANVSGPVSERGLTLLEPAEYDEDESAWLSTWVQYQYIPWECVRTVGALSGREDVRVTKPGERLFEEEGS